MGVDGESCGL